jgi:hypothetical protein
MSRSHAQAGLEELNSDISTLANPRYNHSQSVLCQFVDPQDILTPTCGSLREMRSYPFRAHTYGKQGTVANSAGIQALFVGL